jgi:2'-5' RNA ligase
VSGAVGRTRTGPRRVVPGGTRPAATVIGVSIPVPAPHAAELTAWRAAFGDPLAESIPPHITLLPPTELGAHDVPGVRAHLRATAAQLAPFEVDLRGTGTFRPVSAVVFVQVSRGISECELLQAAVRRGPLQRELAFPYHPHVTVAHDLDEPALDRAEFTLRDWEATFTVKGFSLYEHGADGVWRPQEAFPFGG